MTVQEKRARYRQVREEALALTDKAIAEERQLTEDEVKQLNELVGEGKKLANQMQGAKLGAPDELMKRITEFSGTPGAWSDDPADQLKDGETLLGRKDGDQPNAWTKAITEACKAQGTKAFGMPTGSVPLVSLEPRRCRPSRTGCSAV